MCMMLAAVWCCATARQTMWVHTGQVHWAYKTCDVGNMLYVNDDETLLTVLDKDYAISDIDSITVDDQGIDDDNVLVSYDGSTADVTIAGNIANYITASVDGAQVSVIQSSDVASELTYTLTGDATDGMFYHEGSYKITLILNGVNITNTSGPAINIQNGKRIAIELAEGTDNYLTDSSDNGKKACFLVKGHAEFSKAGNLTIAGNKKHAFASNEYCEIKKTVGTITITNSVADAFNVVEYFQMNGGTVVVESTGDDGIQCDADDVTDPEADGHVLIKGGTLTLNVSEAATKGIKADGEVTISGGTVNINHTGTAAWDSDDSEVKSPACIKSDRNITISGDDAVVTLVASGSGAKGISCDTTFTISAGTLDIKASGAQYAYGTTDTAKVRCVKADQAIIISGGTTTVTTQAANAQGFNTDGTVTITDGTVTCNTYDHGIKCEGDATVSGGSLHFTITGAAAKGFKCDGDMDISGGTFTGTTSGGGQWDSSANETSACANIKVNGNMNISGGTFDLTSTGAGGKGISVDGALVINDGDFTVVTTGARYSYGSSWGRSSSSYRSSPKGIKADGNITINGGTFNLSTTGGEGAEAIESKAVLTVNDGQFEIEAYDDCTNSSSHTYLNGGYIYVHSTNNDGIDANGNIYLTGGVHMVYGSGDPECALDAAEQYNLYITGGTCVGIGGSNWSAPTSTTNVQPAIAYNGTQSNGTTYLLRSGSTDILAWTVTNSISGSGGGGGWGPGGGGSGSSALVVITSPSLTKGSSYTLYSGASVSGDNWHSLYLNPTVSSTGSSVGSVSSLATPYSSIGSSRR